MTTDKCSTEFYRYYKAGQISIQYWTGFTKWDSFYKTWQHIRQMRKTGDSCIMWQPTP